MIMDQAPDRSIREICWSLDSDKVLITWADAVEAATVYAMQLGYRMEAGTGGAYVDATVSATDADIIRDMLIHTDPVTGVYTGDRDAVTSLAADAPACCEAHR